jgi:uncharacterized protein YrzB (UPF0473 family)
MSEGFGSTFVVLTDEEGNEYELEHLDTLEHEGETYKAFTPYKEDDPGDEIEVIILKAEEENGEEILATVDDEELLERVYQQFMRRVEEGETEGDAGEDIGADIED